MWGVFPFYFHIIGSYGIGAFELVAHRAVWSVIWAAVLVVIGRQGNELTHIIRAPRTLAILALSTLAIFTNWTIYIASVTAGRVLETSLGYYINPLMNMAIGALFFHERMSLFGRTAIGFAVAGVALQGVALGRVPLASIGLAASFCAYGVLRKRVRASAQTGLFVECAIMVFPGIWCVMHLAQTSEGHFGHGAAITALLLSTGLATVVPLALFAIAARKLSLTTLGFLQFIAPTLQFICGILLGEVLTPLRLVSFALIWMGVVLFSFRARSG
ncbi:MAG: EamA family transporter RarD [Clostridia bacterium]|nr:EamA family transporter RarD [Deltaproteobacteria bacterium]